MFNSPILDTLISLIFIFLLYSLLATSLSEGFATIFAMRARMLRKGLIKGMFSNTIRGNINIAVIPNNIGVSEFTITPEKKNTWYGVCETIKGILRSITRLFTGIPYKYHNDTLGADFYLHPIIKNFGSGPRYSIPSYISNTTFVTVLTDVLDTYYKQNIKGIAAANGITTTDAINLPKLSRINYLVKYWYRQNAVLEGAKIDFETLQILNLYLNESYGNENEFNKKLSEWYDTTMDRVSGWYKRYTQYILLILGFIIAFSYNVDIVEITGKLSHDSKIVKALADQGQHAVQNNSDVSTIKTADELANMEQVLALGWGDFGFKEDSLKIEKKYKTEIYCIQLKLQEEKKLALPDDLKKIKDNNVRQAKIKALYHQKALQALYDNHWFVLKCGYVLKSITLSKFIGFMLLAAGICLGAPFWFDLLQKFVQLRASGKKEKGTDSTSTASSALPTVQVNLTNNKKAEEAAG